MKVEMSSYLQGKKPLLKKLLTALLEEFEYASLLASDTAGTRFIVDFSGSTVQDAMLAERGCVARVYNGVMYSEYSFNELCDENFEEIVNAVKNTAKHGLDMPAGSGLEVQKYPLVKEEQIDESFFGDVEKLPESVSTQDKLKLMKDILEEAKGCSDLLIDFGRYMRSITFPRPFIRANAAWSSLTCSLRPVRWQSQAKTVT